jgi:twinkle protein
VSDITTLKRMLADRAAAVAEHIFPDGRLMAGEWCVGSIAGEPGKSLKVHLDGAKAGLWSDFATGQAGDLIDLWKAANGTTLSDALGDIRGYLGVARPDFDKRARTWRRPARPGGTRAPTAGAVHDYLTGRAIAPEVIRQYRIGARGDDIVFPFLDPAGELIMCKTRAAIDGAKPKPTEANCEKILFGWQAADGDARECAITEGEIDALSLATYGIGMPVLSVPFGGGRGAKQDWIESEFERLERFETVYLCLDDDDEGRLGAEEIASRLGRHRCRAVTLPRNDANQCLVDGVPRAAITRALVDAASLDPAGLRRAGEFTSRVMELFHPGDERRLGYAMAYAKRRDDVRFRPGEVTLWSGASGSGKSQLLSDCTVDWIAQGSRICMASLEMAPAQTLRRMVKQAARSGDPSPALITAAMTWLDGGLWLFDLVGKTSVDSLIEIFDYARARYGCDQFVLDSLMRLGLATDDYNAQERTMYRVVDWAIAADVHVHFVAHSPKSQSSGIPDQEDVKGAMELAANAFNVITVWRNRKLEDDIAKADTDEARAELERGNSHVVLNIAKQRNGDWEGKLGLWFGQSTYQYRSSQCPQPPHARTYPGVDELLAEALAAEKAAGAAAAGAAAAGHVTHP